MAKKVSTENIDEILKEIDKPIQTANVKQVKSKSVKEKNIEKTETKQETPIAEEIENENKEDKDNENIDNDLMETYYEIFGKGYSTEDYEGMYKKFCLLRNNYPLKTAFHTEALATYVKYAYRRDRAIAEGDSDMAKTWGVLAKDQADKAKINPNQLSVADLSDGMTSFSQLSSMVEKAQDIIPLLPEFKEQPKDRVDYTLWEYVNCVLHLFGKPLIEYKELYKFLDYRYESLKKRYKFIKKEDDGNFDTDDVDSEDI